MRGKMHPFHPYVQDQKEARFIFLCWGAKGRDLLEFRQLKKRMCPPFFPFWDQSALFIDCPKAKGFFLFWFDILSHSYLPLILRIEPLSRSFSHSRAEGGSQTSPDSGFMGPDRGSGSVEEGVAASVFQLFFLKVMKESYPLPKSHSGRESRDREYPY